MSVHVSTVVMKIMHYFIYKQLLLSETLMLPNIGLLKILKILPIKSITDLLSLILSIYEINILQKQSLK